MPVTGIDYLGLIDAGHTAELAGKVSYSALAPEPPVPGQAPGPGGQEQPRPPAAEAAPDDQPGDLR